MNFLKSIFVGKAGHYHILGVDVEFRNYYTTNNIDLRIEKIVGNVGFKLVTQGYAHVFVHEMGHALANKLLNSSSNGQERIAILTQSCTGYSSQLRKNSNNLKDSIISAAGPMFDVTFCICKLMAAAMLIKTKNAYLLPGALVLAVGGSSWMFGEILYACTSVINRNSKGDFRQIANNSSVHLICASVALITQCALGIFATIKLIN